MKRYPLCYILTQLNYATSSQCNAKSSGWSADKSHMAGTQPVRGITTQWMACLKGNFFFFTYILFFSLLCQQSQAFLSHTDNKKKHSSHYSSNLRKIIKLWPLGRNEVSPCKQYQFSQQVERFNINDELCEFAQTYKQEISGPPETC